MYHRISVENRMDKFIEKSPDKWKIKGFTKFPNQVLFDERLNKKISIPVLLVLYAHSFGKKRCFVSLKTIQKITGLSRQSIIKSNKNLVASNYIVVEKHAGKNNVYNLIF